MRRMKETRRMNKGVESRRDRNQGRRRDLKSIPFVNQNNQLLFDGATDASTGRTIGFIIL